jgi:hypothetical protein
MTRSLLVVAIAAVIALVAGCAHADSPDDERAAHPERPAQTLEEFARSYLVKHVCADAPSPERLAERIAQAIRERPGTTWGAAAAGICNKTRH